MHLLDGHLVCMRQYRDDHRGESPQCIYYLYGSDLFGFVNRTLPFPNDPFPNTFSKLKSDSLTFPPNLIGSSLSETDDF